VLCCVVLCFVVLCCVVLCCVVLCMYVWMYVCTDADKSLWYKLMSALCRVDPEFESEPCDMRTLCV